MCEKEETIKLKLRIKNAVERFQCESRLHKIMKGVVFALEIWMGRYLAGECSKYQSVPILEETGGICAHICAMSSNKC